MTLLNVIGFFHGFEARCIDASMRVFPGRSDPRVCVVAIGEQEFVEGAFRDRSPLDPAVLARLVHRIGEMNPAGLLMDIQIHPAPFEDAPHLASRVALYDTLAALARAGTPVILLRSEAESLEVRRAAPAAALAWDRLCGDSASKVLWADPTFELEDGIVRGIRGPQMGGRHGGLPSALGAMVRGFGRGDATPRWRTALQDPRSRDDVRVRFNGCFLERGDSLIDCRIPAGLLLRSSGSSGQSMLEGRFVLLGGTYSGGRDEVLTPLGAMPGVYVWAEALSAWLTGQRLYEPVWWVVLLFEILTGLVFVVATPPLKGPWIGWLAPPAIMFLAVLFSWLSFGTWYLFVAFLPTALGAWVHDDIHVRQRLRDCNARRRSGI